jgi:hypothetical protein
VLFINVVKLVYYENRDQHSNVGCCKAKSWFRRLCFGNNSKHFSHLLIKNLLAWFVFLQLGIEG